MTMLILVELAVAFFGGVVFIVLYATRSPWWTDPIGRHMMAFVVVSTIEVGLLLALGMQIGVPLWMYAVAFGLGDVVVYHRLYLLLRAQRGTMVVGSSDQSKETDNGEVR